MSAMLSRWPVVLSVPIDEFDVDDQNVLTDAAIARIFGRARTAYFELCSTIDESSAEAVTVSIERGCAVEPTHVTISVGVVEIYPNSFTLEARLCPAEGEGIAARVRCSVTVGELTEQMRDEFIALAHAARAMH
jgi:acyl-CoA thioesterase FadM